MLDISKYFHKFRRIINSSELQKSKITEIIKRETKLDITKENLEIKNGVIYLNISPAGKNMVFINKSKILEEIKNIKDIR